MLKILQARLQQFVNQELPDVQPGFIFLFFFCKPITFQLKKIIIHKNTFQHKKIKNKIKKFENTAYKKIEKIFAQGHRGRNLRAEV